MVPFSDAAANVVPMLPPNTGVTVTVEVTAVAPALTAVNVGIVPVPEAAKPIVVFAFVQL